MNLQSKTPTGITKMNNVSKTETQKRAAVRVNKRKIATKIATKSAPISSNFSISVPSSSTIAQINAHRKVTAIQSKNTVLTQSTASFTTKSPKFATFSAFSPQQTVTTSQPNPSQLPQGIVDQISSTKFVPTGQNTVLQNAPVKVNKISPIPDAKLKDSEDNNHFLIGGLDIHVIPMTAEESDVFTSPSSSKRKKTKSQLHDKSKSLPQSDKISNQINYSIQITDFGFVVIASTNKGLCFVGFVDPNESEVVEASAQVRVHDDDDGDGDNNNNIKPRIDIKTQRMLRSGNDDSNKLNFPQDSIHSSYNLINSCKDDAESLILMYYPNADVVFHQDPIHLVALSAFRLEKQTIMPLNAEKLNQNDDSISTPAPIALPLHFKCTPAQLRVWKALLDIPFGSLCTYHDIAVKIGNPNANRAVGNAVGANPITFIIPCHRVVKADGTVGQYLWGTVKKMTILAWEQGWK
jgi:O-6-methylguanine DNA methyltransferase